ncbi:hypothetical protein [Vibrio porteresiae]|uniref:Uncharacterized protein n=1 Tax=Vibrio porteresiae DSM 19223 TaxID=1123496 RepID=A0ABZ0QIU8_9VIBR|nr:hypothetical protein [Vibrio porteresiae]WPC75637.1 hypothetical protein R8Z52_22205 [Vibrio porteresiae DSM 19223]
MSVSSVGSGNNGYAILQQSKKMADEAAQELSQTQALEQKDQSLRFNRVDSAQEDALEKAQARQALHPDQVDSLIKLNQAQQYNRAGVTVVQKERDMLGSLLDLRV